VVGNLWHVYPSRPTGNLLRLVFSLPSSGYLHRHLYAWS
jgi:hypothetical protein